MDTSKTTSSPSPREKANFVSIFAFWWTKAFFKQGYNHVLGAGDLYDPIAADRSNILGDRLEKQWNAELITSKKENREPNLLKAIFRTFLPEIFIQVCIQIFNEFIKSFSGTPLLLGALLQYFKPEPKITYEKALIYAGGIALTIGIRAITFNHHIFYACHLGGKIRIAVCSIVYRKALRLSKTALGETAPGKIVNLVANDVNRFDYVCFVLHYVWSAPLLTLVIGYIMYNRAGYAALIGILVIFLIVPIQSYLGKLSSRFRLQSLIKTDERVRLMDEIISGVKVIKVYAWEKPFCALVEQARRLELKVVRRTNYLRGIFMTFNLFTTRMALLATLVALMLTGEKLSADKVYVFSSLFAVLSITMSTRAVRGFSEEVQLKDAVMAAGHGLDNYVLDRGSNYSVGQRQLVCLARAILRNNRILMLDEATANVDPHTDALIQSTIRTKFAHCTVLTVALRLNTIMDSDKILVMDQGFVAEFDHPHVLLQNEMGPFSMLVKETGRPMFEQLSNIARDTYISKYGDA